MGARGTVILGGDWNTETNEGRASGADEQPADEVRAFLTRHHLKVIGEPRPARRRRSEAQACRRLDYFLGSSRTTPIHNRVYDVKGPGKSTGHAPNNTILHAEGMTWNRAEKNSRYSNWQPADDEDYATDIVHLLDILQHRKLSDFAELIGEV